jgi:hypothetical protein
MPKDDAMTKLRYALLAAALAATTISCAPHHARVGVYADVPGPPALAFESDPYFVPLPGTYAYAVPDYDVDLYYSDGYYWRPWQGRWYRSTYYDRGWVSYSGVPRFYTSIPRGWRNDYYSNRWRGRSWDYARVPRHEVERNWSSWKRERRWDDDQRRYTGDRRWHDHDNDRHADRRDRDGRSWEQQTSDRREPDRREVERREIERREVERRTYDDRQQVERREYEQRNVEVSPRPVDRRTYETREVERRSYDGRQPVQRREVEQRSVEIERRPAERRPSAGRPPAQPRAVDQPRPVVQERRTVEQQRQVEREPRGQSQGRDASPRGRGPGWKDENRDGIDDSTQRRR